MNKFKKFLTVVLAATMVMGMSVTAMAEEVAPKTSATITVENAGEAKLTYAKVLEVSTKTETGWAFTDNSYAAEFKAAFKTDDDQAAIKAYINASESERTEALTKITTSNEIEGSSFDVNEAGLYVISGEDTEFIYSKMAVAVGMDTNGNLTEVNNSTVKAKKSTSKIDKERDEVYVEIGDEITYTVKATVPYYENGKEYDENAVLLGIHDAISGGEYKLNDNKMLEVTVKIGESFSKTYEVGVNENAFDINLSELVTAENSYANATVTLEYVAVAKSLVVKNAVYPTVLGHAYNTENDKPVSVESYAGSLVLTKYAEDGKTPLAGAKFVVSRVNKDATEYAVFEKRDVDADNNADNTLVRWVADYKSAELSDDEYVELTTNEKGQIDVKGFDKDVTSYAFVETEAPTGYSVNPNPAKAAWEVVEGVLVDKAPIAKAQLSDTRLATLPFTGGTGTTMFTIIGVAIMVVAAALFFASRRKSK